MKKNFIKFIINNITDLIFEFNINKIHKNILNNDDF